MVLLKATLYLKPYKRTGDRVLKSDALHHEAPTTGTVGGAAAGAHITCFISLTLLDPVTLMAALWGAAAM